MALKNPAAEEWKPGFWDLDTGVDLVSQSYTPAGSLGCLMAVIKHRGYLSATTRYRIFQLQFRPAADGMQNEIHITYHSS